MPCAYLLPLPLLLATGLAWAAGQTLTFQGFESEVPADWARHAPSSAMRLLQLDVPAAEGGEGGQLVVYYFGPGQGGSLEANLERWKSQFTHPDGSAVEPVVTTLRGGGPCPRPWWSCAATMPAAWAWDRAAMPYRTACSSPRWWRRPRETSTPSSMGQPPWWPPSDRTSSASSKGSARPSRPEVGGRVAGGMTDRCER